MPIQDYDVFNNVTLLGSFLTLAGSFIGGLWHAISKIAPPLVKIATAAELGKAEFTAMRVALEGVATTTKETHNILTDVQQRVMDLQLQERRDTNAPLTFKSTRK